MDTYYVLIPVPISTLLIVSIISYYLGLRIINAIGLGTFLSLISIIILHRFKFDENGKLIYEQVDLYVSIYIISCICILIFTICYLMCKYQSKTCCYKEPPGPESLYQDIDGNYIDSIDVHPEPIEPYNDLLESSTSNITIPSEPSDYSNSKIIVNNSYTDYNSYYSKTSDNSSNNLDHNQDDSNNNQDNSNNNQDDEFISQSLPNNSIIRKMKHPTLKIKRYNKDDVLIIKDNGISIDIETKNENSDSFYQNGLLYENTKKTLRNLDSDTDDNSGIKRGYNSD